MVAWVVAGCVVSDPPTYGQADQTPPWLNLNGAVPPVFGVLDFTSNEQRQVKVPVRSEDAGDELIAQLYLNYNIQDEEQLLWFVQVPPSTFDDTSREILIPFQVPPKPGCHQLSMVVTHSSHLLGAKPTRADDIGIATWWVAIDDGGSSLVSQCPRKVGGN